MKTSSSTPPSHMTPYRVQCNGALVQQRYKKLKLGPLVHAFCTLKFL
jgi:hypothetical protein